MTLYNIGHIIINIMKLTYYNTKLVFVYYTDPHTTRKSQKIIMKKSNPRDDSYYKYNGPYCETP